MSFTAEQLASLDLRIDDTFVDSLTSRHPFDDSDEAFFEVIGPSVVKIALKFGYEPVALIVRDDEIFLEHLEEIRLNYPAAPIYLVDDDKMRALIGINRLRGLIGIFKRKPLDTSKDIFDKSNALFVIDGEATPLLVGNLVRSAAALWADAVLFSSKTPHPLYSGVVRGSTGNIFLMPFGVIDATGSSLDAALSEAGYLPLRLCGKSVINSTDLNELALDDDTRIALIVDPEAYETGPFDALDRTKRVHVGTPHDDVLMATNASVVALWILSEKSTNFHSIQYIQQY